MSTKSPVLCSNGSAGDEKSTKLAVSCFLGWQGPRDIAGKAAGEGKTSLGMGQASVGGDPARAGKPPWDPRGVVWLSQAVQP